MICGGVALANARSNVLRKLFCSVNILRYLVANLLRYKSTDLFVILCV